MIITSHIMISDVKDTSNFIEVASYNCDLGLEVGELITINNRSPILDLEQNYTVRVKSKSKIINKQDITIIDEITVDDEICRVRVEYIVESENKEDEIKSFVSSDIDLFLMSLVELVDNGAIDTHITLFLKGMIITGVLISENNYFYSLKSQLRDVVTYPLDEKTDEYLESFKYSKYLKNIFNIYKNSKKTINREFIHLSNVRVLSGNHIYFTRARDPWRGRLSCIDGFMIGEFKMEDQYFYDD